MVNLQKEFLTPGYLISDLLRVPAGEGEVLQRGADGAFVLGALQSGWQKHSNRRMREALLLRNNSEDETVRWLMHTCSCREVLITSTLK